MANTLGRADFLPTRAEDTGGKQLDFVLVTGDAYVDHPSFGTALIGRYLQHLGYSVGIIAQPDWHSTADFMRLGKPRYAFMAAAGNIDSMVNNYTASKKRRGEDLYSPGGKAGLRPDRATIVYANRIRQAYPGVGLIIAGVEASLRRFAHYDYWDDAVRRSILFDAGADMLIYGMAERATKQVCARLASGERLRDITGVAGTCTIAAEPPEGAIVISSYETVRDDKRAYAASFAAQYRNQDPIRGKTLAQQHGQSWLVAEPPAMPLSRAELDEVYAIPFTRTWHPDYDEAGGVPALSEVKFSIAMNRGCFGECAFCALTFHQGRIVQSRSTESVVREARLLTKLPDFKGYIHDIGGPSANFTRPACDGQLKRGACMDKRCLSPKPCKNLVVDQSEYVATLKAVRALPGVKKVFVRSGVRFDYALLDKSDEFLRELCAHHVSGQLKVAPEHVTPRVLRTMGKPDCAVFDSFRRKYAAINEKLGKEQYMVPYFMSSHPGCTLEDAVELAVYLRANNIRPEQVQDFYPTPGTLATAMFHTGLDPLTMKSVYVPRAYEEKLMQRALLQCTRREMQPLARKALRLCGRGDLIGYGPKCIVPPENGRPGAAGAPKRGAKPAQTGKRSEVKPAQAVNRRDGAKPTQAGYRRDGAKPAQAGYRRDGAKPAGKTTHQRNGDRYGKADGNGKRNTPRR